jgi:acyl carrier protein
MNHTLTEFRDGKAPWPTLRQEGPTVFRWAVWEMVKVARPRGSRCAASDLAAFVPHQANMRIIDEFAKQLKLPDTVVIGRDIETTGNTSAASIPLATHRLLEEHPELSAASHCRSDSARDWSSARRSSSFPDGPRYPVATPAPRLNVGPAGPTPINKENPMAFSNDEVLAGLAELITDETGISADEVALEKSFTDDLDIDSISMMTIVVNAEEKFGVTIPDEEVKNLKTVGDAVTFITTNQA